LKFFFQQKKGGRGVPEKCPFPRGEKKGENAKTIFVGKRAYWQSLRSPGKKEGIRGPSKKKKKNEGGGPYPCP